MRIYLLYLFSLRKEKFTKIFLNIWNESAVALRFGHIRRLRSKSGLMITRQMFLSAAQCAQPGPVSRRGAYYHREVHVGVADSAASLVEP